MKIGEFARLGQVSVRMLRHYESLGLLTPHAIDRFSGHRRYDVAQLTRLNRIMALNSLGLPLKKIAEILDSQISTPELARMLNRRRHQLLAEQIETAAALADVEFRLALIERSTMEHPDCIIKELPADSLIGTTVLLGDPPFDTSEIGPLFARTAEQIEAAGGEARIGVGLYADTEAGTEVTCGFRTDSSESHKGTDDAPSDNPRSSFGLPECTTTGLTTTGLTATGLTVTDLEPCTAATLIHAGPMSGIGASWQHLSEWCLNRGYPLTGPCREIYLESGVDGDDSGWVVELQQPIAT